MKNFHLHLARRSLHSNYSRPAQDPGYFGLFDSQVHEKQTPRHEADLPHDEAHVLRKQLQMAFRDKVREWARTTPPEYISKSSSRLRSRRRKPVETHERKELEKPDRHAGDEDKRGEEQDDDVDDEDEEFDVVDDEDELNALDREDADHVDVEDEGIYDAENVQGKSSDGRHRLDKDIADDAKAHQKTLSFEPPNVGHGDADDEELYYFTESGKLKYKPILILAPKDEIYERLSKSGLVSSRLKRPLPVLKLVKKTDAEIVGWYYYCSIELLQFFRICHNLKEVKAIVEYHIRWSAIWTLAKKYRCNPREIVKKYGRDLECEDKKGKKVRLMTRLEIKEVVRGVNKRVQMCHRFLALNILDEMD